MRIDNQNYTAPAQEPSEEEGRFTWQLEGQSSGRFASKVVHYPGGNSGVTIGRGYDMGSRSAESVVEDLTAAGLSAASAVRLAGGAGLKGAQAARFVRENRSSLPSLTNEQELKLFSTVTYPRYVAEAKRLTTKSDVVKEYGNLDLDSAAPKVKTLVVDLLYRGDYTPSTRRILQKALVSEDPVQLCKALKALNSRRDVPAARAEARDLLFDCYSLLQDK